MANPFLAMNEDFAAQQNPALNPFLSGDFGGTEVYADNPFAASNPFSDFGAGEFETAVTATTTGIDYFGVTEPITTSTGNFFSTSINECYENQSNEPLFSTAPSTTASSANFFDTTIEDQHPIMTYANPTIQKPTDLDLNLANALEQDSAHVYLSDDENTKQPKRPPPPARPIAPETKDLILSVTGHMELTSTHLLDRIPPTRTPSPVSMRDLHSPSPTPEHAFGDFLTDGEQKRDLMSTDENDVNMFDVDDVVTQYSCSPQQNSSPPAPDVDLLSSQANKQSIVENSNVVISMQEPSPKEEAITQDPAPKPPRPGPPVRPPPARPPSRPAPPQKPPPPNVAPQRPPPAVPPHHPPHVPPHVPPPAHVINPVRTNDPMSNDFSLFDAPTPQFHPKTSTKEDILSLYSTPKKHEEPAKPMDFLTDDMPESMEPEMTAKEADVPKKIDTPIVEQPVELPKFENTSPQPTNVDVENSNVVQSPPKPKREPPRVPDRSPTVEHKKPVHFDDSFNREPEPQVHFDDSFNIQSEEVIAEPAYEIPKQISPEIPAAPFDAQEPVLESNPFGAQDMVISQADIFNANVEHSQTISDTTFGTIDAFASNMPQNSNNIFNEPSFTSPSAAFSAEISPVIQTNASDDIFDDFAAKFESTVSKDNNAFDAFGSSGGGGGGGGFDDGE